MRSPLVALVVLAVGAATAACGADTGADEAASPASEATTGTPTPTPTPTPTETAPAPSGTASPPTSPSASAPGPSTSTPKAPASPSPTATRGAQRGLRAARADARTISPELLTYFNTREFPLDLGQLRQALGDAGVSLAPDNSIGGYGLSGDGANFVLCVQHDGGGWASYNTAVGKVDDAGTTGACPGG